jgi:peptidoglycan/xylan/chitin deacetylase (PgdA/CDA1 family)
MGALLRKIPIPVTLQWLRRYAGVNPLIVNYHVVSDRVLPHIKHLYHFRKVNEFKKDIGFLRSNYSIIDMTQFLQHIKGDSVLPHDSALITFDDGFREIYDIAAPMMYEMGVPATFFLTTDLIDNSTMHADNKRSLLMELVSKGGRKPEFDQAVQMMNDHGMRGDTLKETLKRIPYHKREVLDELGKMLGIDFKEYLEKEKPYLTSSEVKELINQGFAFGAHSLDHPRFSELDLQQQIHQTVVSVDRLVDRYKLDYRVFAFPYSDHGVSRRYFEEIYSAVDATFGTQGLLVDSIKSNYQRISLEKFPFPARRTVKFEYLRNIIYTARKRVVILRD